MLSKEEIIEVSKNIALKKGDVCHKDLWDFYQLYSACRIDEKKMRLLGLSSKRISQIIKNCCMFERVEQNKNGRTRYVYVGDKV